MQKYRDHREAVNDIVFVEKNRKFVSFSDDKKVIQYEFGVDVILKNIFYEEMGAVNSALVDPSESFIVGQTIESKILLFDIRNHNIIWKNKEFFRGHESGGY